MSEKLGLDVLRPCCTGPIAGLIVPTSDANWWRVSHLRYDSFGVGDMQWHEPLLLCLRDATLPEPRPDQYHIVLVPFGSGPSTRDLVDEGDIERTSAKQMIVQIEGSSPEDSIALSTALAAARKEQLIAALSEEAAH
jgi:hypothetical protein